MNKSFYLLWIENEELDCWIILTACLVLYDTTKLPSKVWCIILNFYVVFPFEWVILYILFVCSVIFFLNWTFEPNNVVTLEVRFSPFSRVFLFFFFDCCRLSLCHGSAWGINVRLSQVFSEPASFAVHAQWLSKLPFLNCICGYF